MMGSGVEAENSQKLTQMCSLHY